MSNQPSPEQIAEQRTLFGHPTGLYMLFFAEMWERFSYYGMRALLVLYILKGFLSRTDGEAYAIYGAYTSLVYATPFIGGMIADKLLGARRAVILGGLLMAAGHLVMTIEVEAPFFIALALLIVGNGFFKPNISTIVGSLYPEGSPQRDAGFTIFYIGINLGAAMAPLLCGYVGENYGWHYGFGLATIGMLIGLAVFVAPPDITRVLILAAAVLSGGMMIWLNRDEVIYALGPNALVALCLMIAGVVAFIAISKAGLPSWAGEAPSIEKLKRPVAGPITAEWAVYIGSFVIVPLIALMVSQDKIAGWALIIGGAAALFHLISATLKSPRIERERLQVVLILMFFTMLFWAFFEQAGSSINLFTDRNVNRVFPTQVVSEDQVGSTIQVDVTQGLTGYYMDEKLITMADIDTWKDSEVKTVDWTIAESNVGMPISGSEVATSQYQAANPMFIMLFGLVFSSLWVFMGKRNCEPSTPVKFALGIFQLGLAFAVLWYAAVNPDPRGMVNMGWLLLSYLLITTGELCLSPVGLSMVTKLAPKSIVSMVMGAWFLATAFSNYLAALIAMFTGVEHGEETGSLPPPTETAEIYAGVFGPIAVAAIVSAVIVLLISPKLTQWMHENEEEGTTGEAASSSGG
ncbi:MAG: MFS transporter [Rubripirellula sp.]|nr:MFS transporter [Rubripirellula sp.]